MCYNKIQYVELKSSEGVIRGMLHFPAKLSKKCIIILHGYFSSNKIGPHRLYFNLANKLSKLGYNVLRFDFSAMGESDGEIEKIKYNDHLTDAKTAISYMKTKFKTEDISLIGHCSGGILALDCNNIFPNLNKTILIAPTFINEKSLISLFGDDNTIHELFTQGYTYRKGLYADSTFFLDKDLIESSTKKLLMIMAEKDEFADLSFSLKKAQQLNCQTITIKNSDHNFLNIDIREKLFLFIIEFLGESEK